MIDKISYEEVSNIAKELNASSTKMKEILEDTTNKMQAVNTEETWKSAAASNLYDKFKTLSAKFESFYTAINNYSQFLNQTVETYRAADAAIKNASDNLAE